MRAWLPGDPGCGGEPIWLDVVESKTLVGRGEMAEWLKAHAWKACIPQGIQGSNPCLSAIIVPLNSRSL